MQQRQQQQHQPAVEHTLPCSLQELYSGGTKKMKVSRTVHDQSGRGERISEILSIDIKPGWKKGTKITFPEKGMQSDNHTWSVHMLLVTAIVFVSVFCVQRTFVNLWLSAWPVPLQLCVFNHDFQSYVSQRQWIPPRSSRCQTDIVMCCLCKLLSVMACFAQHA